MKRLPTILFFHISLFCFSQENIASLPIPPNCVWIKDNLFIDKTEIANIHWLEFLHYVRKDSGEAYYKAMLPDTTIWNTRDSISQINYFRSSVFQYYPVVGISHHQAVAFSMWRTNIVNLQFNDDQEKKDFRFIFRLPTEHEWVFAASAGLDSSIYSFGYRNFEQKPTLVKDPNYYWEQIKESTKLSKSEFNRLFKDFQKYGREPMFNCIKDFFGMFSYGANQPLSIFDKTNSPPKKLTSPQSAFIIGVYQEKAIANGFGISSMIGNVAEMLSEKGVAKGGSWTHSLTDCKISNRIRYSTPSAWLGFRCIGEVISVNSN
ncbi:MAG: formylglycine-generating enzyme family protein [Cyclobacteriaceae bacterium]|nr:formylglycine-generating enzyme family protein [Cyclobacteriaceae bacterium]